MGLEGRPLMLITQAHGRCKAKGIAKGDADQDALVCRRNVPAGPQKIVVFEAELCNAAAVGKSQAASKKPESRADSKRRVH